MPALRVASCQEPTRKTAVWAPCVVVSKKHRFAKRLIPLALLGMFFEMFFWV